MLAVSDLVSLCLLACCGIAHATALHTPPQKYPKLAETASTITLALNQEVGTRAHSMLVMFDGMFACTFDAFRASFGHHSFLFSHRSVLRPWSRRSAQRRRRGRPHSAHLWRVESHNAEVYRESFIAMAFILSAGMHTLRTQSTTT